MISAPSRDSRETAEDETAAVDHQIENLCWGPAIHRHRPVEEEGPAMSILGVIVPHEQTRGQLGIRGDLIPAVPQEDKVFLVDGIDDTGKHVSHRNTLPFFQESDGLVATGFPSGVIVDFELEPNVLLHHGASPCIKRRGVSSQVASERPIHDLADATHRRGCTSS